LPVSADLTDGQSASVSFAATWTFTSDDDCRPGFPRAVRSGTGAAFLLGGRIWSCSKNADQRGKTWSL
jgi:hypothetical protein